MAPTGPDNLHSTLEVDFRTHDTHKVPVIAPNNDGGNEAVPSYGGMPALPTTTSHSGQRILGLRRRTFWLATALLAVCVIIGAVVGGVVGSRSRDTETPPRSSPGTNSTRSSNLAAVYYYDQDYMVHYRLYIQKDDNWIHEYTKKGSGSWTHTSQLELAVEQSPIAATVVYQDTAFDLRVYFASEANFIQEYITRNWTQTPTQWTTDPALDSLSKMNIRVLDSSNLAALWLYQNQSNFHPWCLYQDTEDQLTLRGSDGWITEDVSFPTPSPGTPLAMTESWRLEHDLKKLTMFYQDDSGQIQSIWGTEEYSWDQVSVPVPAYSSDENTTLAAFVYTPSDDAAYMGVLLSNSSGVTSFVIRENEHEWKVEMPSAMSSLDHSTPLAATPDGRAFGISNGVVKEFRFSPDGSWGAVGDVIEL